MPYDRKKIYKQAEEAIKKNNLFFIEEVVAYLPIVKKTFYEWWPPESNESNSLKELLDHNKIKTKSAIRAKLYRGTKASELIALYKLIATDEERKALSMNYHEANIKIEEQPLFPDVSKNDSNQQTSKP